jgi:hypothetical protein
MAAPYTKENFDNKGLTMNDPALVRPTRRSRTLGVFGVSIIGLIALVGLILSPLFLPISAYAWWQNKKAPPRPHPYPYLTANVMFMGCLTVLVELPKAIRYARRPLA